MSQLGAIQTNLIANLTCVVDARSGAMCLKFIWTRGDRVLDESRKRTHPNGKSSSNPLSSKTSHLHWWKLHTPDFSAFCPCLLHRINHSNFHNESGKPSTVQ